MFEDYSKEFKDKYKIKTGRDTSLFITNVESVHRNMYEAVLDSVDGLEILDLAVDKSLEFVPGHFSVYFKNEFDFDILQEFWKEIDRQCRIRISLKEINCFKNK